MGERSFGARWWRESLGVGALASRPAWRHDRPARRAVRCRLRRRRGAGQPTARRLRRRARRARRQRRRAAAAAQRGLGRRAAGHARSRSPTRSTSTPPARRRGATAMANLAGATGAAAPALQPYYVPTLFQSLIGPAGQRLRAVMRPIHTRRDGRRLCARPRAARRVRRAPAGPSDTALVVDAPGPRAVALAAALADRFAPVFTFGNWPHPLGVVPAHETLAASLYYLPMFAAAGGVRAARRAAAVRARRQSAGALSRRRLAVRQSLLRAAADGGAARRARRQPRALRQRRRRTASSTISTPRSSPCAARASTCKMVALSDFVRAGDEPAAGRGDDVRGDDEGDERGRRGRRSRPVRRGPGPFTVVAPGVARGRTTGIAAAGGDSPLLERLRLVPRAATASARIVAARPRRHRRRPTDGTSRAAARQPRRVAPARARRRCSRRRSAARARPRSARCRCTPRAPTGTSWHGRVAGFGQEHGGGLALGGRIAGGVRSGFTRRPLRSASASASGGTVGTPAAVRRPQRSGGGGSGRSGSLGRAGGASFGGG